MYKFSYTDIFKKAVKKIRAKDYSLFGRIDKKVNEIIDNPFLGKPLRNILKNNRRVHVGNFVLVYRINEEEKEVRFLDFDHHDKIYKKY